MKSIVRITGALLALALVASPAWAGYKLMPAGQPIAIRKSVLTVTPSIDWNRLGPRVGRNAEVWTIDGISLNDMTFYAGIGEKETLFREVDKKNRPLPQFSATMLAPDIVQLFEGSYRIANGTSLFEVEAVEPATLGGHPGFRFSYHFTVQEEEVKRKGEAQGAIIGGKLYLITYEAPEIHYFDSYLEPYRRLVESAKLGVVAK